MSASSKKKLRKEQNAAVLSAKQLTQQKEVKKLRNQTIAFVVVITLVLVIGLGSLAVTAYNNSGITERLTTALTIGDHKISSAELGYFYYDAINSTYSNWYDTYGDYTQTYIAMLYGLDLTKPFDEQMYDEEKGMTFADYFIDIAVQNAVNTYTMYDQAVAKGEVLDETGESYIDYMLANMNYNGVSAGYSKLSDYLKSIYGNGATEESVRDYLKKVTTASSFESATYSNFTYSDTDIDAYSQEHFNEFSSYSYNTFYVSRSDLLVCTADEDDEEHEHSQEEMDAAMVVAKEVVDAIIDAKPTTAEELNEFVKTLDPYAEMESAVCTELDDQLYSSITEEKIAEWVSDSSRKSGDITFIEHANETTDEEGNTVSSPYGYTIVLFEGRNDNEMKLVNVRHILKEFTGATTDPEGNTVYPDSSDVKAKEAIAELQKTWLEGDKSEEAFAALVTGNTDDTGSAQTGGLYEDVYPGQMVAAFNDWCFDEARQPGDYGIIETEYGCHLMYFSSHSAVTYRDYMVENAMRNEDYSKWYQEQIDAATYTVNDTSKLKTNISFAG